MLPLLILFLAVGSALASAGIADSTNSPTRGRSSSRAFRPNHNGWGSRESLLIPEGQGNSRRSRARHRGRQNRSSPSSSSDSDSGYSSLPRFYVNQAYQHNDDRASRNRNARSGRGPPRSHSMNVNLAGASRRRDHAPVRAPAGIVGPYRGASRDQQRPSSSSVTWSTRSPDDSPPRS